MTAASGSDSLFQRDASFSVFSLFFGYKRVDLGSTSVLGQCCLPIASIFFSNFQKWKFSLLFISSSDSDGISRVVHVSPNIFFDQELDLFRSKAVSFVVLHTSDRALHKTSLLCFVSVAAQLPRHILSPLLFFCSSCWPRSNRTGSRNPSLVLPAGRPCLLTLLHARALSRGVTPGRFGWTPGGGGRFSHPRRSWGRARPRRKECSPRSRRSEQRCAGCVARLVCEVLQASL